jgi:hypothetical protein
MRTRPDEIAARSAQRRIGRDHESESRVTPSSSAINATERKEEPGGNARFAIRLSTVIAHPNSSSICLRLPRSAKDAISLMDAQQCYGHHQHQQPNGDTKDLQAAFGSVAVLSVTRLDSDTGWPAALLA